MKKLESILVATDLSDTSDEIMRAAATLAELFAARLHVLHVFEFQDQPYGQRVAQNFQAKITEGERALEEQIKRAVRGKVNVASREGIIYTAHKAIHDRAHDVAADVIVLGRHRRKGMVEGFLGGTADRVIRSADVPCLIISAPMSLPLRKVVVPIDLSEPAVGALDVALQWSAMLASGNQPPELVVLHVIPQVYNYSDVPLDRSAIGGELTRQVAAARTRVAAQSEPRLREEVRWGDSVANEIQTFVAGEGANLVVLGTHGHGPIKRALIGSVAAAVARSVPTPVLLVPPALSRTTKTST